LLTPASPLALVLIVIFIYGVGRSMQFSLLATLAYADVPPPQMNAASTLWSAAAQMSIGLGIAFGAVSRVLRRRLLQPLHLNRRARFAGHRRRDHQIATPVSRR
jgi:hypothetical protein